MLGVIVFYKQICLVLGLMVGINLPIAAEFKNPFLDKTFSDNHAEIATKIANFNKAFGSKSTQRETAELLLLSLLHNGIEVKNGTTVVNVKNGVTITRDELQKKATYGLLNKIMLESKLKEKAAELNSKADTQGITLDQAKKDYEKNDYDKNIRPYLYDGFDIIFRGIKYWNDPTKVQTVSAYLKNDIVPYLIKKKIIWMTQKAARGALERHEYGQWIAGAYDIACLLPVIGTELEILPRFAFEYLYDKGLAAGKRFIQKKAEDLAEQILMPFLLPIGQASLDAIVKPLEATLTLPVHILEAARASK